MSTPVQTDTEDRNKAATMYAPPWARDGAREAPQDGLRDAPAAAGENALAASEQFRRTLPPATQLTERRSRWREPTPYEGDLAVMRLRERPTLDPSSVPAPPMPERGSRVLGRVVGAVALAALAAFFMVSATPFSLQSAVKAEGEPNVPSLWSRLTTKSARLQPEAVVRPVVEEPAAPAAPAPVAVVALADRFAAVTPPAEPQSPLPTRGVQTIAVPVAPPPQPEQTSRALDRDEIDTLYRRSQDLVAQGDIASGRLLLTRAAEAGDARSAFALGATYDPAVLGKLGVLGVVPDREKAKAWYIKATQFGSTEAARRLEQLAHAGR